MVPTNLTAPPAGWSYRIDNVRVTGPEQGTFPPSIMPATLAQAMERSLRDVGLFETGAAPDHKGYALVANIVSQNRRSTFKTTTLELVVSYSLVSTDDRADVETTTIVANGDIDDWKIDACA